MPKKDTYSGLYGLHLAPPTAAAIEEAHPPIEEEDEEEDTDRADNTEVTRLNDNIRQCFKDSDKAAERHAEVADKTAAALRRKSRSKMRAVSPLRYLKKKK